MIRKAMSVSFGLLLASFLFAMLLIHTINVSNRIVVESEVAHTQDACSRTLEMLSDLDKYYVSSLERVSVDHRHGRSLLTLKQQVSGMVSELNISIAIIEKTGKHPHLLHLCRQLQGACIELLDELNGNMGSRYPLDYSSDNLEELEHPYRTLTNDPC